MVIERRAHKSALYICVCVCAYVRARERCWQQTSEALIECGRATIRVRAHTLANVCVRARACACVCVYALARSGAHGLNGNGAAKPARDYVPGGRVRPGKLGAGAAVVVVAANAKANAAASPCRQTMRARAPTCAEAPALISSFDTSDAAVASTAYEALYNAHAHARTHAHTHTQTAAIATAVVRSACARNSAALRATPLGAHRSQPANKALDRCT